MPCALARALAPACGVRACGGEGVAARCVGAIEGLSEGARSPLLGARLRAPSLAAHAHASLRLLLAIAAALLGPARLGFLLMRPLLWTMDYGAS
eukprot:scaffold20742_cov125-Isochrysis_galbana.AAC.5